MTIKFVDNVNVDRKEKNKVDDVRENDVSGNYVSFFDALLVIRVLAGMEDDLLIFMPQIFYLQSSTPLS